MAVSQPITTQPITLPAEPIPFQQQVKSMSNADLWNLIQSLKQAIVNHSQMLAGTFKGYSPVSYSPEALRRMILDENRRLGIAQNELMSRTSMAQHPLPLPEEGAGSKTETKSSGETDWTKNVLIILLILIVAYLVFGGKKQVQHQ